MNLGDGPPSSLLAALLLCGPLGVAGQAQGIDPEVHAFVDSVSSAGHRFSDIQVAIAEGYRKLGPDFPGMGEHWINPGLVIEGAIDPRRPPVIAYTRRAGEHVLLGFAFTRVLGPGDEVPISPLPARAWHDHTAGIDEESLILAGPASMHEHGDDAFRLSMVHVWTHLPNPNDALAQNNWALPFFRAGFATPEPISSEAARALSLEHDGGRGFYRRLLRRGLELESVHVEAAMDVFSAGGDKVEEWMSTRHRGRELTTADIEELEAIWSAVWWDLAHRLPAGTFERLRVLSGS